MVLALMGVLDGVDYVTMAVKLQGKSLTYSVLKQDLILFDMHHFAIKQW